MAQRTILTNLLNALYLSPSRRSGWTLIEVLVVTMVVGILGGMAVPSFMKMKARMDTRNSLSTLKQTLQQAQRNAIKMGKKCQVQLNKDSDPPKIVLNPDSEYNGCLPYQETILTDVKFDHNFSSSDISFSYKGNSTNLGTMVVESKNVDGISYCLVMSNMIGMMRSGDYEVVLPTVSASHCKRGM